MRLRLTHLCLAIAVSATVLYAPGAGAFTFENGLTDKDGKKFDVEEQAKAFRKNDLSPAFSSGSKREIDTPFGKGTLQFGTQPFAGSGFGSKLSPRDVDRMVAPPGLQHRYDN
jgi:hypothetical protein